MKEIYALGVGHSTPLFIEIAEAAGWHVSGLFHYNDERTGEIDHGFKILGSFNDLLKEDIQGKCFLPTMGDMKIRNSIIGDLINMGGVIPTIIHPSSHISRFAHISEQGVVIGAHVEIQNDVILRSNVIIRTDVTVCHNVTINHDVFVGPKALIGAYSSIKEFAYIGQAAVLVSGKAGLIGHNTLIGAGSLVTKPIPDNVVVVGCPARVIKQR